MHKMSTGKENFLLWTRHYIATDINHYNPVSKMIFDWEVKLHSHIFPGFM